MPHDPSFYGIFWGIVLQICGCGLSKLFHKREWGVFVLLLGNSSTVPCRDVWSLHLFFLSSPLFPSFSTSLPSHPLPEAGLGGSGSLNVIFFSFSLTQKLNVPRICVFGCVASLGVVSSPLRGCRSTPTSATDTKTEILRTVGFCNVRSVLICGLVVVCYKDVGWGMVAVALNIVPLVFC